MLALLAPAPAIPMPCCYTVPALTFHTSSTLPSLAVIFLLE